MNEYARHFLLLARHDDEQWRRALVHLRLIAVGDRQPAWVDKAFDDYSSRFPPAWKFRLDEIPTRVRVRSAHAAAAADGERILQRIKPGEAVIALDESGHLFSSRELADRLRRWQSDGRDLCFVIGGPDGLAPSCLQQAELIWSLSKLTLPHGLARVLLAEQLYRAWTIDTGHPYHRD